MFSSARHPKTLVKYVMHSHSKYGLETQLKSLCYPVLFTFMQFCARCTVTELFQYNGIIQQQRLGLIAQPCCLILILEKQKDLCTGGPSQHENAAHYRRFEVCRVSRPYPDRLCLIIVLGLNKRHAGLSPGYLKKYCTNFHECLWNVVHRPRTNPLTFC